MADPRFASHLAEKYLQLHLCNGVGPIRFANLLRELGDIDTVLGASATRLANVSLISPTTAESIARDRSRVDVAGEIEQAARRGVRILCLADEEYPAILKMINDPPPCLYLRGALQKEDAVAMAIVGSRHCSRYGAEQAERFGALLANAGLTIVSGMARGIDQCAHRGALAGGGRTIAVLGCGLSHLYPPESADVAARIAEHGAVVSELPMDVAPDSKNFPPRNRIIAGLTLGVLVVEAAKRSGALISARVASEYNREVFAVPGRIDTPHAEGCHTLIKSGAAKLVTGLADILEDLGPVGLTLMPPPTADASNDETHSRPIVALSGYEEAVLKVLDTEPMSPDAICRAADMTPARVATTLTGLQLKGVVRQIQGAFVRA